MADEPTQPSEQKPAKPASPATARPVESEGAVALQQKQASIVKDAQAFIEAAYAGEITDTGEQPADPETSPATPEPTPAPVATAAAEDGAAEVPAAEAASTEKRPSRKDREAEARAGKDKPAPAEPAPAAPQPTREEVIAEYERQQQEQRDREATAARQREQFAAWTGNTVVEQKPDGTAVTAYDRAKSIADQTVPIIPYEATQEQWAAYNQQLDAINAARAQLSQFDHFRGFLDRVDAPVREAKERAQGEARAEALSWFSGHFEHAITGTGGDLPSILAAGAAEQRADAKVPAMLRTWADQIKASATEPLHARIEEQDGEIAAKDSEIDTLKRQLAGQAPQAERGGVAASSGRPTIEALDAIAPKNLKLEDLNAFMDMLPAGPSRRRSA